MRRTTIAYNRINIEIDNGCQRKIFLDAGVTKVSQGVIESSQGCDKTITGGCDQTITHNNTSSNNLKNNGKEITKEKHRYGEYHNVLLSDEELAKLKSEFPSDWQERIERVSGYCASKGTSYKNYLATIRNWAKRDAKNKDQPARQPYRKNDVAGGYQRVMEILGGSDD